MNTGYLTQISASLMELFRWLQLTALFCGRGTLRLFLNGDAVLQLSRNRHGHAIAGLQSFRHFKSPAALVFGLACGPNLVLGNLVAMEQENFVEAIR